MEQVSIGPDSFVAFAYSVFEQGKDEPVDAIDPDEPIEYVHGYGQILPILEKTLLGKNAGQKFTVEATADDAFGEHDDEGVFEVDREGLEVGDPEVGDELHAKDAEGHVLVLRVLEVGKESIVVDANHPLAGKAVRFEVEVLSVRAATDDEIDAAQQEVEAMAAEDHDHHDCGHDHSHDGHDHHHEPAASADGLVKLGRRGTA